MKILRYFVLLLFMFSIFSPVLVFAKERDYKQWHMEHQWLMLKQEKERWKSLKSNQEKEYFVEEFYEARDPDTFTAKNEFKLNYQKDLEKVRKNYPDLKDSRRYIYLLFGEPQLMRVFTDQVVFIPNLYSDRNSDRIRVSGGEIWKYGFGRQNFQVIFAKLDPQLLQWVKNQSGGDVSSFSFYSSKQEILYIGSRFFTDIATFLESFFQESLRLQPTSNMIKQLKKPILERAKKFYKKSHPKVRKKQYPHNWEKGLEPLINRFDINLPEEMGISVWLMFDKNSLDCSKKKKYRADISLYCEIRDSDNKRIIYYRDDDANYELKKKQRYYYHFWGSLPVGDYTLILEVGDNITGKKYREEFKILDYFVPPVLKANIWVGRVIKEAERIKGKPSYFSLSQKEGTFCPAASSECFYADDELVVIFNVSGFRKNHYGISYVETGLSFVKGKIENRKFVPIKKVYKCPFFPVEKDESWFQSWAKFKIRDLVEKSKLPPGLHWIRVELSIEDAIANQSYGPLEYSHSIRILSTALENIKKTIK